MKGSRRNATGAVALTELSGPPTTTVAEKGPFCRHRIVVKARDELLARVDDAGELLGRCDLGRDVLPIPTENPGRDMQLPNIARLSAGEAKRGDMSPEPRCPYRKFELP